VKKLLALATALSAVLLALPSTATAQSAAATYPHKVTSSAGGVEIDITVYKPAGASDANPVPVVLFSHGWGGSKADGAGLAPSYNEAGFGYVTITQRGFGASGGEANVQDPELEAEDIQSVIDYIATLSWVKKNTDSEGNAIANDPVLGAIGGSYGGGYQTVTALDEIAEKGSTRFDALVPEITWYDLNESLAPQGVVRTAWVAALYAAGNASGRLPKFIHEAFAFGTATGQWPDGTFAGQEFDAIPNIDAIFGTHSPRHLVEDKGARLDIPVLMRQGASDNLFNLNQGLKIFDKALTTEAQKESLFVSFNGGHALPNAAPRGTPLAAATGGGTDACSGNWNTLRLNFLKAALDGDPLTTTGDLLPARFNFTDLNGTTCHRFDTTARETVAVNEGLDPTGNNAMIATAGLGAPVHLPLGVGGKVTGTPVLSGEYYSGAIDTRAFFALSVGTTPADATVIQNNVMPLRSFMPSLGEEFEIELPAISVQVPEGQQLFLTISPVSDMFFGHGSRTPGGFLLTDLALSLPRPNALAAAPVIIQGPAAD
jgi:ABC-2 type transport system ATP-binding protein